MQDEKLAQAYQSVVEGYLSKDISEKFQKTTIRMVPSTFPCGKATEVHNQSSGCFRRLSSTKRIEFEQ